MPTIEELQCKVASLVADLPNPDILQPNGGEAYSVWLLEAELMTVS